MGTTEKALQALGFGSPFIFAAATYGFFLFLQRKASPAATRALSGWIRGRRAESLDVGDPFIGGFDAIYSTPLLSFEALSRSGLFSIVNMGLYVILMPNMIKFLTLLLTTLKPRDANQLAMIVVGANIVSDYVSLFVVRRWLVYAKDRPGKAIFGGFFSGVIVILFMYTLMTFLVHDVLVRRDPLAIMETLRTLPEITKYQLTFMLLFAWPALMIYLWLPLLGIGMLVVRILGLLGRAVAWMQWFIRQGRQKPFEAVGMVAALIVFLASGTYRLLVAG